MRSSSLHSLLCLLIAIVPVFALAQAGLPETRTGRLHVVLFPQENASLAGAKLKIAGQEVPLNEQGAALLELPEGNHVLEVQLTSATGVTTATVPDVRIVAGHESELIAGIGPDGQLSGLDVAAPESDAPAETTPQAVEAVEIKGRVHGLVVSIEDGAAVADAKVFVRGEPVEATTDAEGRFTFDVASGTHAISVIRARFGSQTINEVVVPPQGAVDVTIELTPSALSLDDFVITAPHVEGGVAALMAERRETTAVAEVIGAEQMSKSGDSSAASALRRVTGLTLVGGKFIFVRGMGDRYSSTLLNGLRVPSPEPDQRVVPLDLFPAGLLESVLVQKSYSPDMPGDFGGGVVSMRTKGYPEELMISVSGGIGGNTQTTFRTAQHYEASQTDWLGFDDGSRALPDSAAAITDQKIVASSSPRKPGLPAERVNEVARDFPSRWAKKDRFLLPEGDLSLAVGNRFQLAPRLEWGFAAAGLYSHRWEYVPEERRTLANVQGSVQRRSVSNVLEREVFLGGMLNTGFTYLDQQRLEATTMLLRQSWDGTLETVDAWASEFNGPYRQSRYQWVERELLSQQVTGEQRVHAANELKIDWKYAFSRASREEPDRLDYLYQKPGTQEVFTVRQLSGSNERFFSTLEDNVHEARLDLTQPLPVWRSLEAKLKAGGAYFLQNRAVDTRRFLLDAREADRALLERSPEEVFAPENIGVPGGLEFEERTLESDSYTGKVELIAGYGALELPLVESVDVSAGVRAEKAQITAITNESHSEIDTLDVLPSATATWRITDAVQLRAGFAQTVNRPDLRELVPSIFNDVQTGINKRGNPELKPATLRHYDARVEWYLSADESVSLGGFYKTFDDPIEVRLRTGATPEQTWDNADGGYNMGIEVEGRKLLGFMHEALEEVHVSSNFAYIKSSVDLKPGGAETSKKRALAGQSPWILNLQLGYEGTTNGLRASILYNVAGARIDSVGVMGLSDVIEQPFHQLDLVISKELEHGFRLSGKAANLGNSQRKYMQGPIVFRSYRPGVTLSLDLTWNYGS